MHLGETTSNASKCFLSQAVAISCPRLIGLSIATPLMLHAFSCYYSSFMWLPLSRQFLLQATSLFVGVEMTFRPGSIHELTRHLARHCSSSRCWQSYYSSGHVSGLNPNLTPKMSFQSVLPRHLWLYTFIHHG